MEIRQLRYFVAIVEAGSLSRASQALFVAQPALSQQVNRLEDELGVKLLTRSVRGVVPTDAGLAVLRQARAILKQVEATRLIASQADHGPAGTVAVGLPWTVAMLLGLTIVGAVREQLPAVRLEIVEGPSTLLAGLLAQGKVDVAVLFDPADAGGLALEPICVEPLLFIGASGTLAGRGRIELAEAAALPLFLLSRPNGIREAVEAAWAEGNVKPKLLAEINSPGLLLQVVQAGLGYSVLPSCGIDEQVRSGRLDAVQLGDGRLTRTVHLGTSRLFPLTPATEAVEEVLKKAMADAIAEGRWSARRTSANGQRAAIREPAGSRGGRAPPGLQPV